MAKFTETERAHESEKCKKNRRSEMQKTSESEEILGVQRNDQLELEKGDLIRKLED